ncbi:MAG: ABC transporter permease [Pirellulales bacterium]|nr:ABC transporter permease [Pirellulales bacterium]
MRFSTVILKNLLRSPARSLLTVCGAAVAIGTLVALVGIARNFQQALRNVYDERGVDLVVTRAGASQGLNSAIDESLTDQIARLPGVAEVTGGLIEVVSYEDQQLYGVLVHGWRVDSQPLRELRVLPGGRRLAAGDARHVMLGKVLAANLGLHAGQTLEIVPDEPFEVVGVFESFSVFENGGMVIPLDQLQRIMDLPGKVTGFTVTLAEPRTPAAVERLRREIEDLAPGLSAMTTRQFAQTNSQIRVAAGMAWVTSLIALVIGAAGTLNTMLTSVLERTRELGILRSLGWPRRRIAAMILGESLALGLIGAGLGAAGAVLLVRLLCQLPQVNGYIDGQIGPETIGHGFVVAAAFALLGGLYPARLGMRMLPAAALRT